MQPHQAAVCAFGQRVQRQQFSGMGQRVGPVARAFGHVGQVGQGLARARAAALALLRQPGGEFAPQFQRHVGQQVAAVEQVVLHAGGQLQRGLAFDQRHAELPFQLEQALAQRVAGLLERAAGPQQRGQVVARRGALERQPGQQGGVARRQRRGRGGADAGAGGGRQLQLHAASIPARVQARAQVHAQVHAQIQGVQKTAPWLVMVGTVCSVMLPLPSWPKLLSPQHSTDPLRSAQVKLPPAATACTGALK